MTDSAAVVTAMWRSMQDRDWATVGALLAEDVVVEWPASDEKIVGRERFVGFNQRYPEGWAVRVLRVVADGDEVVAEVEVPHTERGVFRTVGLWTVRDGQIVHGTEYWTRLGDDPSPEWCTPYVERR